MDYRLLRDAIALARENRKVRLVFILTGLLAILVMTYGCSVVWGLLFPRATRTYAVRGAVLFQGTPLASGEITFEPEPNAGQARTAIITGGTFQLQAREGLPRGKRYTLRIRGYRKTGQKYANADMSVSAEISEQILPPRYNSDSTLKFESTAANLHAGVSLRLD